MAELKIFEEGEVIYAREINENFSALQKNNSDFTEEMEKYLEEEIASIQSNVESVQLTLQNNINTVNDSLEALKNDLGKSVQKSNYQDISSGTVIPSPGLVYFESTTSTEYSTANGFINGVKVYYNHQSGDNRNHHQLGLAVPVRTGDVVTTSGKKWNVLRFYPYEEVTNG
jgi:hypothetical protein